MAHIHAFIFTAVSFLVTVYRNGRLLIICS